MITIMRKNICIISIMLFTAITVQAQFIYNNGKVGIATQTEVFEPILMVGDHSYFGTSANASIGTGATPYVKNNTNNI